MRPPDRLESEGYAWEWRLTASSAVTFGPAAPGRGPVHDHPSVQSRDGAAPGAHEERRHDGVYETGQGGEEERPPEAQSMALMLEIGLADGSGVLEE